MSDTHDPNIEAPNRTFEIISRTLVSESPEPMRFRIRFKIGDPDGNTYSVGNIDMFGGMICEHLHGRKWTPWGWGFIPVSDCAMIREIIPELEDAAKKPPAPEQPAKP